MKNIAIITSVIVNALLLALIAAYLFTPYLDFSVINTSMPRLCKHLETTQPEVIPTFCELDQ